MASVGLVPGHADSGEEPKPVKQVERTRLDGQRAAVGREQVNQGNPEPPQPRYRLRQRACREAARLACSRRGSRLLGAPCARRRKRTGIGAVTRTTYGSQ